MAKKDETPLEAIPATSLVDDALKARVAELEAALAAAKSKEPVVEVAEYPTTVYQKLPEPTDRWPSGYKAVQVTSPDDRARLHGKWVDSPAKLAGVVLLALSLMAGTANAGPLKAIGKGSWKVVKVAASLPVKAAKAIY